MVDVGSAVGYLLLDLTGWNKGISAAKTAFNTFLDETATGIDKAGALGSALSGIGMGLTTTVTAPLVGLGTAAVKTAGDFQQAMAQVAAVSGLDTASKEFDALSDKAKEMGATTKFSASEAAEAFNYMAMAGWDAQQMMDGISGVMDLAAASGEDLATVSDIVTDALTGFGLQAKDSAHFADVLAAASNSANTNVSMLGESFKYVAPVAGALGFSVEDVSVALGLMANSGIKASQAGTSLRSLFTNLVHPTGQAADAIEALGINVTNADGTMKDLDQIMNELRKTFGSLTDAEKAEYAAMLAGQEGMSGLLAIVNATDADFQKLTNSINEAGGTAEEMADKQLDTLEGKFTMFKSAMEGLAISFGEVLLPAITDVIEKVTEVITWFNELDDGTKKMIVTIVGIVAAIGPIMAIVGNIINVVVKLVQVIKLIKGAIVAVKGAMVALNAVMLANPIGLVIAAIAALVAIFVVLWNKCDAFREFWINLWESIKEAFAGVAEAIVEAVSNIAEWFSTLPERIGEAINAVVDWFTQLPGRISSAIGEALNAVANWGQEVYNSLSTGVSQAVNAVVQWFDQLPSSIGYALGYAAGSVVSWAQNLYNTVTTELPKIIDSILSFFGQLPSAIAQWLQVALDTVVTWGINVVGAILDWLSDMWDTFTAWFTNLPYAIAQWLSETISAVVQWGQDMIDAAGEAMGNFIDGIVKWLKGLPDQFKEWFGEVVAYLESLPDKMYEIGSNILKSLWDGLKSVVSGLFDWIGGVVDEIKGIFSSAQQGYSDATRAARKVSGSYATGLDYVPRDMNVRVHEGERILTKQENASGMFNNGGSGGIQTVNFDLSIPMDGQVLARAQYSYNLKEGSLRGGDLVEGGNNL